MRLALYEPDIAQNTGSLMRLCACFGVGLDIIEPCGFVLGDRRMKRAGMDYIEHLDWVRHNSWEAFLTQKPKKSRLILMTTKGAVSYLDFAFEEDDILLMGRESKGVPDVVHGLADARLLIPMKKGMRSINQAMAGAMVLGESLRQLR